MHIAHPRLHNGLLRGEKLDMSVSRDLARLEVCDGRREIECFLPSSNSTCTLNVVDHGRGYAVFAFTAKGMILYHMS